MTTASWAKGRNGDWLVRTAPGREREAVQVAAKSGSVKTVVLGRQVWSDAAKGVALYVVDEAGSRKMAALAAADEAQNRAFSAPRPARGGGRRTGCPCGSVEDQPSKNDCWQCRHDG